VKIWINGRLVQEKGAKVSVFDRGFMYGDGAFETMRAYAGKVFKLERHLARLYASLRSLGIKSPYSKDRLKDIVYKCLAVNGLKGAYIKLTVTRGEGRFGIYYKDVFRPNAVVVAKKFGEYPETMHSKGISAAIVSLRQNEYSHVSWIKSLNFLAFILARLEAKRLGSDEAIMLNTKGYVTEAATSNIFLVKKGALITPSVDSGCLPGITRGVIIEIARRLKIPVREARIPPAELTRADEIFLTNSLVEVLPVTRLGRRRVSDGLPGELTKLLHISYQKQVIRETLL
jgi:branched-chain amino acid aminotransferase